MPVACYVDTSEASFKKNVQTWWARRDLNPHERKAHKILSLACIPISPLALKNVDNR